MIHRKCTIPYENLHQRRRQALDGIPHAMQPRGTIHSLERTNGERDKSSASTSRYSKNTCTSTSHYSYTAYTTVHIYIEYTYPNQRLIYT
mmetsp:Transcript_15299/g.42318  ORF Transcript_15299/g.42318 Transcript_15299/m.42318 type:complete len:90 (-) Transcript_15299:23-292(-)